MNEQEKLCTLCMDEISLKMHLYYDVSQDKITGLEDFGSGYQTNKVANSALVILLRSISGKWKQPIGYALVNGSCPTDEMEETVCYADLRAGFFGATDIKGSDLSGSSV